MVLLYIVLATFSISLLAWSGILFLHFNESLLEKIILPLVSFSAGTLLGGAFLHFLPKAVENLETDVVFLWVLVGFIVFFILEQFINWHHCHRVPSKHKKSSLSYLILVSDGLHMFIGGLSIAGAFLVDLRAGFIAWLASVAHELPQEFGQFGILIHGGWEKLHALSINFFVGLSIVFGGLVAYLLSGFVDTAFLLPFAAGNFMYIAASDIIPEIKREPEDGCKKSEIFKKQFINFFYFLIGITLMYLIKLAFS